MDNEKKVNLPRVGEIATGTVVRVYPTYAILLFEEGWTGLLHISELSNNYIRHFSSFVTTGAIYNVKVISVDEASGSVRVSLKQMSSAEKRKAFLHKKIDPKEINSKSLEDKLPEWVKEENEGEFQS